MSKHRPLIVEALVLHLVHGFALERPPGVPRRRWWRAVRQAVVWLERCPPDADGFRRPRGAWWWRSPHPGVPLVVSDLFLSLNSRAAALSNGRAREQRQQAA